MIKFKLVCRAKKVADPWTQYQANTQLCWIKIWTLSDEGPFIRFLLESVKVISKKQIFWVDLTRSDSKWLSSYMICIYIMYFRDVWKPVLYGQVLSILICGTAVTSTLLVDVYHANIPLTQSLCNYVLLTLFYGSKLAWSTNEAGEKIFFQVGTLHFSDFIHPTGTYKSITLQ